MDNLTHLKVTTKGCASHYISIGEGPVVLYMHGWPQNHSEFLPVNPGALTFSEIFCFENADHGIVRYRSTETWREPRGFRMTVQRSFSSISLRPYPGRKSYQCDQN